jgi:DNA-binding response OmpR family regulator
MCAARARALILADEPALLRLVARLLEEDGYTVTAADPADIDYFALQQADPPFDLVVINSFLPEQGIGSDTTTQVQALFPESAIVNLDDTSQGPFSLDRLLRKVHDVLDAWGDYDRAEASPDYRTRKWE